jgi:hypothetical protein
MLEIIMEQLKAKAMPIAKIPSFIRSSRRLEDRK